MLLPPHKICGVYLAQTWQTRLVGRLAQRHQGGGRRPGDSRSAECHTGLVRDTAPLHHPAAPCPKQTCQTRQVGRLAQRHQGGGRRPGDSRSAECHASLVRDTTPLHHPADRIQTWHSPRRGCCPHACRCACCAAPPRGRTPPWGGPAADSFAPTLGTACPSLPPEGANPALGRPGGGLIWPGRVGRV